MSSTTSKWKVRAVKTLGCAFTATLAVGTFVGIMNSVPRTEAPISETAPITDPMTQHYDTIRIALDYGCSATGLGPGVIAGGGIVWYEHTTSQAGGPTLVDFDTAWAIYQAGPEAPGRLLAVCVSGPDTTEGE